MYIPYEKIGTFLAAFLPDMLKKNVKKFFIEQKTLANCRYIDKNSTKVLKKLKKEIKKRKLKVAFYVYDETKWKLQSLYDLFASDEHFEPVILVTKNCSPKDNCNYQSAENAEKVYSFFKDKGLNTEYAYDCENNKFIPFEHFKPDIIFYQHPWYVETTQGPVVCSRFALTYYVPYYLPSTTAPNDYYLRFHRYVHKYYVLNEYLKKRYTKLMKNKGKNLCVAGSPQLDYFYLNKQNEHREYVIYAPHWTVNHETTIAYSTFLQTGKIILEFAQNHPEIKWIFKPHPLLKSALLVNGYLTAKEVNDYYEQWKKIGIYHDSGDYLNLFEKSYAMITDCGSFMTEFFMTKMPLIRLVSPDTPPFDKFMEEIMQTFYNIHNENELSQALNTVVLKKEDPLKEKRLKVLKNSGLNNNYAALNILNDIKSELETTNND